MEIVSEKYQDLFVDQGRLSTERKKYALNPPFPHICYDGFFNDLLLEKVLAEFPDLPKSHGHKTHFHDHSNKFALSQWDKFGLNTKSLILFMLSERFCGFLSQLTGIKNLITDMDLFGGGLHEIKNGGYLDVHVDFNKSQDGKLDRRLNLLLYLNKDWKEENGGQIELWNKEITERVVSKDPVFNRMMIFSTTTYSHHGNPNKVVCDPDNSRKSIALYYYTKGRPEDEIIPGFETHNTIYEPPKI